MQSTKAIALSIPLFVLSCAHAATSPGASTTMIENGGHRVAFHVTPGHEPTIVLDAGGGLDSSYWDTLVPELSKRTGSRVITYDRAGFGASDEVKGPWNVLSATADLAAGLKQLGATHNVVLVSHSIAGEIATYLVRQHPDWVRGAVLVDANVPDYFTDETITRQSAAYQPIIAAARAAPTTPQNRQLLAVADSFQETSRAFHNVSWPSSVPAIVIVSEKTPFEAASDAQWWTAAHEQFAKHASNRKLVIAERSSHDVAHDRPDVILEAVAKTLELK